MTESVEASDYYRKLPVLSSYSDEPVFFKHTLTVSHPWILVTDKLLLGLNMY